MGRNIVFVGLIPSSDNPQCVIYNNDRKHNKLMLYLPMYAPKKYFKKYIIKKN